MRFWYLSHCPHQLRVQGSLEPVFYISFENDIIVSVWPNYFIFMGYLRKMRWKRTTTRLYIQWFIYNFGLMGPGTSFIQYQWVPTANWWVQTLFLMTSLQYYCIPGLAGTRWNKNVCAKDAGCAGNKITVHMNPLSRNPGSAPAHWQIDGLRPSCRWRHTPRVNFIVGDTQ